MISTTGEYRQLGIWQPYHRAVDAAPTQSEHLNRMFRADNIGIPDDDEGRCYYRLNVGGQPILNPTIQFLHFGDQLRPVFGFRRYPGI